MENSSRFSLLDLPQLCYAIDWTTSRGRRRFANLMMFYLPLVKSSELGQFTDFFLTSSCASLCACLVRIPPSIELFSFFPDEHSTWNMRNIILDLSTKSKPMPVFLLVSYNKKTYRNESWFIF